MDAQKSLEDLVDEREQMVGKIVGFMSFVLSKLGTSTRYVQFSDHTNERRHLNDFYGFDMSAATGEHATYGCEMVLRYGGAPVFEAAFIGGGFDSRDDQSELRQYVPGDWEQKLLGMIKNKEKIVADWKALAAEQEQNEARSAELNRNLWTKTAELEKRAVKLRLPTSPAPLPK